MERKERFELSSRVWKTRMFPATSLPQVALPAGLEPATSTFEASRSSSFELQEQKIWSGRTESNCHHECPRLGCLRYTTPRWLRIGAPGETRTHNPLLKRQVP